jgi:hypothetical protein
MNQKTRQLDRKARRPSSQPRTKKQPVQLRGRARPDVAAAVSRSRPAPKLRRPFPTLEPEREAFLRDRNRAAIEDDPRRAELERRLLDLGGTLALLFLPDPSIGELLARGRYFPGGRALMRLGLPSCCHSNAALLPVQTDGAGRIAFGYALSPDGLWRQHSWGLTIKEGRIVETTERRVRYFGIVLDDAETMLWLLAETHSGNLWPEEVEDVRRFIRESYDLPAEHVDQIDRCEGRTGAPASSRARPSPPTGITGPADRCGRGRAG